MKNITNVIIISDLHAGCRLGLCPEEGVKLDDGGRYMPSEIQVKVHTWWEEFWNEWVPIVCRGEPFIVVCNGDAMDGVHHGSVTQISHNLVDQKRCAYALLKPVIELCEGRYFHLRGTEAHGGKSGQMEEELAEQLGAIKDKDGKFARWELYLKVGEALVHITHHIGTCGSLAYESSAVQKELEQSFVEAARWGQEPVNVIVRSHRHRNIETRVRARIRKRPTFATACVTAGWQLKTPFVYRIAGARQSLPQIGGTLIRYGDEDVYTRHQVWEVGRPETEAIEVDG